MRERGWRGESMKYQSKSCTIKYNVYKPLPPIDHHTIQTQANPVGLSPLPLLCRAEKTNSAREETIYRDPTVQREHRTRTAKQTQLNRGRKVGNQAFTHSPPPSHHYIVCITAYYYCEHEQRINITGARLIRYFTVKPSMRRKYSRTFMWWAWLTLFQGGAGCWRRQNNDKKAS